MIDSFAAAKHSRWQEYDGFDECERSLYYNPHQTEGKENEPYQREQEESQDGQRPAHRK